MISRGEDVEVARLVEVNFSRENRASSRLGLSMLGDLLLTDNATKKASSRSHSRAN